MIDGRKLEMSYASPDKDVGIMFIFNKKLMGLEAIVVDTRWLEAGFEIEGMIIFCL